MKAQVKRRSSLSESDKAYIDVRQDKIELRHCPQNSFKCREHLSVINENYRTFEDYIQAKDYFTCIENFKNAYYTTLELKDTSCLKCAVYFRSMIYESLKAMHQELGKMSTGIFKNRRYKSCYLKAAKVLQEFENIGQRSTIKFLERKKKNAGFFSQRHVS